VVIFVRVIGCLPSILFNELSGFILAVPAQQHAARLCEVGPHRACVVVAQARIDFHCFGGVVVSQAVAYLKQDPVDLAVRVGLVRRGGLVWVSSKEDLLVAYCGFLETAAVKEDFCELKRVFDLFGQHSGARFRLDLLRLGVFPGRRFGCGFVWLDSRGGFEGNERFGGFVTGFELNGADHLDYSPQVIVTAGIVVAVG
jgi:hypothetical protein